MKPNNIPADLEERARAIINKETLWQASPEAAIVRELALTRDRLNALNKQQEQLDDKLLEAECALGTELLNTTDQKERATLRAQLQPINTEQRRLMMTKQEKTAVLHRHMLTLLTKHTFLSPEQYTWNDSYDNSNH